MGNEASHVEYEGPPEVLEGRDIPSLAKYIKSENCKNVFVMVSNHRPISRYTLATFILCFVAGCRYA